MTLEALVLLRFGRPDVVAVVSLFRGGLVKFRPGGIEAMGVGVAIAVVSSSGLQIC